MIVTALWLPETPLSEAVEKACEALTLGKILLYPTDTTFAMGVDALNATAVEMLFAAKGRDRAKSMAACFPSMEEALVECEESELLTRLATALLPGPVTLLGRRRGDRLLGLAPDSDLIGFRVPDHPFCLALCQAYGRPITATSANLSGTTEAVTGMAAQDFAAVLNPDQVFCVLEEATLHGRPSTIVDASGETPRILRAGPISEAEVMAL